jgi:hypothetical protein
MEDLFSAPTNSQEPPQSQIPVPSQITPEDLERMKQQARELAVAQYYAQQQAQEQKPKVKYQINQPLQIPTKVVYVRRNLTIAELLVIFAVSCGLVYGVPAAWNFASQNLPRIEVRVK